MAKSDRKTVFVSLLDGTMEELTEISEALEETGMTMNYRPIVTARPIQVTDPQELINSLNVMYGNEDVNGHTRWQKVGKSLHEIHRALEGLRKEVMTMNENFQHVQGFASQANSEGINAHFSRLVSNGYNELANAVNNLEQYVPKEGEKW